jgi:hypothetical protein
MRPAIFLRRAARVRGAWRVGAMTRNFSKALRASDNPQTFSKALRASDDLRPACELRRPDFFLRRAVGARRSDDPRTASAIFLRRAAPASNDLMNH